jgi:O-antigen/teichoic acid export membrane protein
MMLAKLRALWRFPHAGARAGGPRSLVGILIDGVAAAISGLFLSRLLMTFYQVAIVRLLGPELYGQYSTVTATLALFTSMLGLGLDTWLLHEVGRHPTRAARDVRAVLLLKLLGAVVLLALLGVGWSSHLFSTLGFVVGAAGIIFDGFVQTGYSLLRATRHNRLVAIFQTLAPLLLLLSLVVFESAAASVVLLLALQAAASVALALAMGARVWGMFDWRAAPRVRLIDVIRQAWLFIAADVVSNLAAQFGIALLGLTAAAAVVGVFTPAIQTIFLTFLVPALIFGVGLPLLNSPDVSRSEYRRLVLLMSAGAALFGVVAFVVLWFFGGLVLHLLYDQAYDGALPFIRIMSLVPLLKSGSFIAVAVLLSNERQRLRVAIQSAIVGAMLVLGGVLIVWYGAWGAAWSYLAMEAVLFAGYLVGAAVVLRRAGR